MKNYLIAALLFTASPAFAATPAPANVQEDRASLQQIVEIFRLSIINKDKDSFLKLFYSESIPWIGVVTDNSLKRETANKPDPKMPDPQKLSSKSNPRKFIEGIAGHPGPLEEKFDNVKIDSDGEVAQIWFDYSFNAGSYVENWGKESWHLVRTPAGWKISSVIWSMEFNPVPMPKTEKTPE